MSEPCKDVLAARRLIEQMKDGSGRYNSRQDVPGIDLAKDETLLWGRTRCDVYSLLPSSVCKEAVRFPKNLTG